MSKRANGEGTVYQRKDGRWVAVIPLEDGKRKFTTVKHSVKLLKLFRLQTRLNRKEPLLQLLIKHLVLSSLPGYKTRLNLM